MPLILQNTPSFSPLFFFFFCFWLDYLEIFTFPCTHSPIQSPIQTNTIATFMFRCYKMRIKIHRQNLPQIKRESQRVRRRHKDRIEMINLPDIFILIKASDWSTLYNAVRGKRATNWYRMFLVITSSNRLIRVFQFW